MCGICDDLGGDLDADRALRVIDPALGNRKLASAGAGFRIHSMQGDLFLVRVQALEIDSRQFGRVRGIFQKYLPRIHEGLDAAFLGRPSSVRISS